MTDIDLRCDDGPSAESPCRQVRADGNVLWFQEACRRLGMADYAASAWAEWHVKPMQNLVLCMGSVVVFCAIVMATFLLGCPLEGWYPLVFITGYGVAQVIQWGFYWRRGPRHAGTPAHYAGFAFILLFILALMIPAIAGPLQLVPFRNRLLTTALLSIAFWLFVLSGYTGASAPDKPQVPYTTFTAPLLKAAWTTVRVMDPVTDMILVRMLLELAEYPCYWFGQHSACWRYRLLAALTGLFTGLYLVASIGIGLMAGYLERQEYTTAAKRVFVLVHSTAFSCEAALVAVTLLKLMTEARDPRFDGSDATAVRQFRLNVGVTVLSFGFTVVAFVGTVADVSAALTGLRRAAQRLSQRCSAAAVRPLKQSAQGGGGPDTPTISKTGQKQDGGGDSAGEAGAGAAQLGVAVVVPLVADDAMTGAQASSWRGVRVAPQGTTAPGGGPTPLPTQPAPPPERSTENTWPSAVPVVDSKLTLGGEDEHDSDAQE